MKDEILKEHFVIRVMFIFQIKLNENLQYFTINLINVMNQNLRFYNLDSIQSNEGPEGD